MTEPAPIAPGVRHRVNQFAPVLAGLAILVLLIVTLISATSQPPPVARSASIVLSPDEAASLLITPTDAEDIVRFDGQTRADTTSDVTPKAIPASVKQECLGIFWLRPEFDEHSAVVSFAVDDDSGQVRTIIEAVEVLENPETARARFDGALSSLDACDVVTYRTVDLTGPATSNYTHEISETLGGVPYYELGFVFSAAKDELLLTGIERVYLVGNVIYHVAYQADMEQSAPTWATDHLVDFESRIDDLVSDNEPK